MSPAWTIEGLETDLGPFHLGPVDLELAEGRAVAVLGPSGAGKTTLLRSLAGFLPLAKGRILRDGIDLARYPPEARGLGYVPQGLGLFPHRTVERNVAYPMEIAEDPDPAGRTRALLERFHLTALARRRPARLSGGEQQRVALARALAADPSLIVWDEPWQGLDVIARHELGLVLHELRETERIPVVIVTHDAALAFSVADTFVVLHEGRVREQGDAAALLRAPADAFAARFVGYENVYADGELRAGAPDGFRAWLNARGGPEGIAFAAPVPAPTGGRWEAAVRSVRPGPGGVTLEATLDGLLVQLRVPPPIVPPLPTVGGACRFDVSEAGLVPLGGDAQDR